MLIKDKKLPQYFYLKNRRLIKRPFPYLRIKMSIYLLAR